MLMASVKKECVKWLPDTFETKQKLKSFRDTSGLQSCPMFFCAFARLQSNGRDSFQGPQTHQKPRTHEGTSTGDFGAAVPGSGLWGLEFKVQGLGVRGLGFSGSLVMKPGIILLLSTGLYGMWALRPPVIQAVQDALFCLMWVYGFRV